MNEEQFDLPLAELGYFRIRRGTYFLRSSPRDCEHILQFQIRSSEDLSITSMFGFRNREAEAFAIKALREYGDPIFRGWKSNQESALEFSVGEVANWRPGYALWKCKMSDAAFLHHVRESIRIYILPIATKVHSAASLRDLLLSNSGAYRWAVSNGAIRAAAIAFLTYKQGASLDATVFSLRPWFKDIEAGLGPRTIYTAESFLRRAIADIT